MTRLLDTNTISRIVGRKPSAVKSRYFAARSNDLTTCTIVEAELRFGAAKSVDPVGQIIRIEAFLALVPVLDFDSAAAKEYGGLRHHLERIGMKISPNDLMIASIALARGLTLVTHNAAEFARVPGLKIEDWEV